MRRHFRPEGAGSMLITVESGLLGSSRVLVDGREVRPRRHGLRSVYPIVMPDGRELPMRVEAGFGPVRASLGGVTYELEPSLPVWQLVIVLLPIGLVAVGGALGGAVGAVAAAASVTLIRREWSLAARVGSVLAVTAGAILLWLVLGLVVRRLI
jgi:hypothetical protein